MQVRTFLSALGCRWRAVHPLLASSGLPKWLCAWIGYGYTVSFTDHLKSDRLWGSSLDCDSKEAGTVAVNGPMDPIAQVVQRRAWLLRRWRFQQWKSLATTQINCLWWRWPAETIMGSSDGSRYGTVSISMLRLYWSGTVVGNEESQMHV